MRKLKMLAKNHSLHIGDDIYYPMLQIQKHNESTVLKKNKSTIFYLNDLEKHDEKYYALKSIIDEIGRIEASKKDFSTLKREVVTSRVSTEGGRSIVYKYCDGSSVKFLIHEVTDGKNNIIHRDFDAVRIASGQLINKKSKRRMVT